MRLAVGVGVLLAVGVACSGGSGAGVDGAIRDGAPADGGPHADDGSMPIDAESDASPVADAALDAAIDAQTDASSDASVLDGSAMDANNADAVPISSLSDEFNDPATLSNWTILNVLEGRPAAYTKLDIDTSTVGQMTIVPTESFWFDDDEGTLVFKLVTGDFVMQTSVSATNINDPTQAPFQQYNSGGLMVRDPASHMGAHAENWIIVTAGFESQSAGTEDGSTLASNSSLNFRPGGFKFDLVICRLGSRFHIFSRVRGEAFWQDVDDDTRTDLPATLQAGIAAQAFGMPADVLLEFDYVRFAVPMTLSDCTAPIPPH
jgi:hypothetical protein